MSTSILLLDNCSLDPNANIRWSQKNQAAENSDWTFQNSGKIFPGFLCISVTSRLNVKGTSPWFQCDGEFIQFLEAPISWNIERVIQEQIHHTSWAEIMTREQGKRFPTEQHADKGNSCSGNYSFPPGHRVIYQDQWEKPNPFKTYITLQIPKWNKKAFDSCKMCIPQYVFTFETVIL